MQAYGNEKGLLGGLKIKNTVTGEVQDLEVNGLFFAIGHEPATKFLAGQVEWAREFAKTTLGLVDHYSSPTLFWQADGLVQAPWHSLASCFIALPSAATLSCIHHRDMGMAYFYCTAPDHARHTLLPYFTPCCHSPKLLGSLCFALPYTDRWLWMQMGTWQLCLAPRRQTSQEFLQQATCR